ncbi:hypothetical protein Y032_0380g339 [Ancylostoma ceylanicum]|uniref:Saposin B-type domain-containing protein n=1 Tax=Ancylostoma ceylanicum TaxID=53326 RepID=A0A016RT59_9BILA|nr:hypothetical protein Y032_0380g339 [Ancylostoma ceylanicum]
MKFAIVCVVVILCLSCTGIYSDTPHDCFSLCKYSIPFWEHSQQQSKLDNVRQYILEECEEYVKYRPMENLCSKAVSVLLNVVDTVGYFNQNTFHGKITEAREIKRHQPKINNREELAEALQLILRLQPL